MRVRTDRLVDPLTSERRSELSQVRALLGASLCGGALMYLLDPSRGRRRRAKLRDKLVHAAHLADVGMDRAVRDLQHRSSGALQRIRSWFERGPIDDEVLRERIRTRLGRSITHPSAIEVGVKDRNVTLRGPVLQRDVDRLLRCVRGVRGVRRVDAPLEVHQTGAGVPALQGSPTHPRRGPVTELLQEQWAPATRSIAMLAGGLLFVRAMRPGSSLPIMTKAVGAGLFFRGLTNLPMKRLVGIGAGHRAIDIEKTITVHAPIDEVFRFWTSIENFPRFMDHVKEIERLDETHSRWTVAGPGGVSVHWDAVVTKLVPRRLFVWKTLPGASVDHTGLVRFEEVPGGGATRLQIRLSYAPPAGAVGHLIATIFGTDPKTAMDEDLVRMKSILEQGRTTAHGRRVTLEDLPT